MSTKASVEGRLEFVALFVPPELLADCPQFLTEGDYHDEGGSHVGPALGETRPHCEASLVQDVH